MMDDGSFPPSTSNSNKMRLFNFLVLLILSFFTVSINSSPTSIERSTSPLNQKLVAIDSAIDSKISTFKLFTPHSTKSEALAELVKEIGSSKSSTSSQRVSSQEVDVEGGKKSLVGIVSNLHKIVHSFGRSAQKQDKENLKTLMKEIKTSLKIEAATENDKRESTSALGPVELLIDFLLSM